MLDFRRSALVLVAAASLATSASGAAIAAEAGASTRPQSASTAEAPRRLGGLEARIAELHDKLHITDVQARDWDAIAQIMRTNDEAMRKVVMERHEKAETLSAVDDMELYRKAAEVHLANVTRLSAAFTALYATMSDEQKKVADEVFRRPRPHADAHPGGMAPIGAH